MRFMRMTMVVAFVVAALPGFAKDKEAQFKSVEAKHFARAEGVELSPEFTDYLYAELRAELTKAKLFGQVLGEGEVGGDAVLVPGGHVTLLKLRCVHPIT